MREEWADTPLSALARVDRGASWAKTQEVSDGSGTPVVRIANVQPSGLDLTDVRSVVGLKERDIQRSRITDASLLMVGSNGNPERIGNVYQCDDRIEGMVLASFLVGIHATDSHTAKWLFYVLSSANVQASLTEATAGSTGLKNLSIEWLRNLRVPVPPVLVQRRIVDLMTHLDSHLANLRAEREAVLRSLDAARLELIASWPLLPVAEVCSVVAPLVDPRLDEYAELLHIGIERMEKDGGRLLPLETARAERLISSKYLFRERDVVFSKIRPNLRKVVLPGFVGLCSADAYPLTPADGVPGALLREVLLLPSVTEQVVGKSTRTKMPKVNRRELMGMNVPMTSNVEERHEVAAALDALRHTSSAVEAECTRLGETRTVLLAALLQGTEIIPATYDRLISKVA